MKLVDFFDLVVEEEYMAEVSPHLRITPTMFRQMNGNKAQVLVMIPIQDFLDLTASPEHQEIIKRDAVSLTRFNRDARIGDKPDYKDFVNKGKTSSDEGYQWGQIIPPFLQIDLEQEDGRVVGHEGRHRASALMAKGGKFIPVFLMLRPGQGYSHRTEKNQYQDTEYWLDSRHIPKWIVSQNHVKPGKYISTRNWKVVKDNLLGQYRREPAVETNEKVGETARASSGIFPRNRRK